MNSENIWRVVEVLKQQKEGKQIITVPKPRGHSNADKKDQTTPKYNPNNNKNSVNINMQEKMVYKQEIEVKEDQEVIPDP